MIGRFRFECMQSISQSINQSIKQVLLDTSHIRFPFMHSRNHFRKKNVKTDHVDTAQLPSMLPQVVWPGMVQTQTTYIIAVCSLHMAWQSTLAF